MILNTSISLDDTLWKTHHLSASECDDSCLPCPWIIFKKVLYLVPLDKPYLPLSLKPFPFNSSKTQTIIIHHRIFVLYMHTFIVLQLQFVMITICRLHLPCNYWGWVLRYSWIQFWAFEYRTFTIHGYWRSIPPFQSFFKQSSRLLEVVWISSSILLLRTLSCS